jgi:uroporphyrinogen-III synthase
VARILVTRSAPDAETTAAMLRRLGHEAILAPLRVLAAQPPAYAGAAPDLLIATSRNAFGHGRGYPARWLDRPLYCVGERTARAAREAGFRRIHAAAGDAGSLVEEIAASTAPEAAILYLAGEPRGDWLEQELRRRGHRVDVQVRYRMIRVDAMPEAARAALAAGTLDAVLHFSTETARAFFELAAEAGLAKAAACPFHACLSGAIARQAEAAAEHEIRTIFAINPDPDALVALVHAQFTA